MPSELPSELTQEAIEQINRDIREQLRGHPFSIHDDLTKMNYEYEAMAVLDRLTNYTQPSDVGAIYAGERNDVNGVDALTVALFDHARPRIDPDPSVERFNDVTEEWPHVLRGKLAAYEYSEGRDGEYEDRLQAFAEAEGWMDVEYTQTELSHYYDDNPFDDPSLTEREAKMVMVCRMRDLDESVIENAEINDADDLGWWLRRADTAEKAVRAHHYGRNVNEDIVAEAALPDEWEVLDPHSFPNHECRSCGSVLYQIEPQDNVGVPTWYKDPMDAPGITETSVFGLGSPTGKFYRPDAAPDDVICDSCATHLEGRIDTNITIIDDNVVVRALYGAATLKHESDTVVDDLGDAALALVDASFGQGGDENCVRLNAPNAAARSSAEEQISVVERVVADESVPDSVNGPIICERHSTGGSVMFPRTNADAAAEAKEMLDNATEYV